MSSAESNTTSKADAKAKAIAQPIKEIGTIIKKSAWSAITESTIILILGILLVAWPDIAILALANILGAIFIASGIYQIINYFIIKGQNDFFNNSLLVGVISLLVGIAAIVAGENIASILRIIIGIWMVYESLVRINTAIKLHAVGVQSWSYILIVALIMMVLGIFVVFNSGAVIQLIGAMMILTGALGIIGDTVFIRQVSTVIDKITK